jgi:hypothetical protein
MWIEFLNLTAPADAEGLTSRSLVFDPWLSLDLVRRPSVAFVSRVKFGQPVVYRGVVGDELG